MQIIIDTTTITDDEVRGIVALLDTVRPSALADVKEDVVLFDGDYESDITPEGIQKVRERASSDSSGLPWDERIHASSKSLNADGTWRTKRGVDKALVAQVEAELRQGEEPEAPDTVEPAQTVAPPAPPAPEAPKAPLAPPPTPTAPSSTGSVSPFVALMKRVTTAQGAGKLTQPRVKELLESLDKKSIMDLRTDEDALASFAVLLDGEGV